MSVLVPNFQAMPDGAHPHLELSSETSVVVKVPSERVSDIDTRWFAPWPEHRLEYRIEVIAHDLYAGHQSHFEGCRARQQPADPARFFVECQERRQNRSAHYSRPFVPGITWLKPRQTRP